MRMLFNGPVGFLLYFCAVGWGCELSKSPQNDTVTRKIAACFVFESSSDTNFFPLYHIPTLNLPLFCCEPSQKDKLTLFWHLGQSALRQSICFSLLLAALLGLVLKFHSWKWHLKFHGWLRRGQHKIGFESLHIFGRPRWHKLVLLRTFDGQRFACQSNVGFHVCVALWRWLSEMAAVCINYLTSSTTDSDEID